MTGAISASAKSRAVLRASSCSAVSSKSIAILSAAGGPSALPPDRERPHDHQEAVRGEEPRPRAAVSGEQGVDELGGVAHDLRGGRAGPDKLIGGEEQTQNPDRQPPDHR